LDVLEVAGERVELRLPEPPVARDPSCGALHRLRLEPAPDFAPAPHPHHEVGVGEHREVLGHRRQRHVERRGKRGNRMRTKREPGENGAPGRIGERGESPIECIV
jgi:hypothetical protein